MKIKHHNMSLFESMMCNIIEEGEQETLKALEIEKNPYKRSFLRKTYKEALNKLNKGRL